MWAAVMNRAVLRLRQAAAAQQAVQQATQHAAQQAGGNSPCKAEAAAATLAAAVEAAADAEWDCDVHLPAWVSDNEANTVRQRLEGWVDQLLEVR